MCCDATGNVNIQCGQLPRKQIGPPEYTPCYTRGVTTPLGGYSVFIHKFMSGSAKYSVGGRVILLSPHFTITPLNHTQQWSF